MYYAPASPLKETGASRGHSFIVFALSPDFRELDTTQVHYFKPIQHYIRDQQGSQVGSYMGHMWAQLVILIWDPDGFCNWFCDGTSTGSVYGSHVGLTRVIVKYRKWIKVLYQSYIYIGSM